MPLTGNQTRDLSVYNQLSHLAMVEVRVFAEDSGGMGLWSLGGRGVQEITAPPHLQLLGITGKHPRGFQ